MSDISVNTLTTTMSAAERALVDSQVSANNKAIAKAVESGNEMGKDQFLKILITQLSNQDPTAPMEDKEFIAQMAQFSSLEQMTNMSQEFTKLSALMQGDRAVDLLGRTVDIVDGDALVTGKVTEIQGRDNPQLLVNNHYYDLSRVENIRE